MSDDFLIWKTSLNEHVLQMYKQHRMLHQATNNLAVAVRRTFWPHASEEDRQLAVTVFDGFVGAAQRHFAAEENFMMFCRYPNVLEHIADHESIIRTLREMRSHNMYLNREVPTLIDSVVHLHEIRCDAEYQKYFISLPQSAASKILSGV